MQRQQATVIRGVLLGVWALAGLSLGAQRAAGQPSGTRMVLSADLRRSSSASDDHETTAGVSARALARALGSSADTLHGVAASRAYEARGSRPSTVLTSADRDALARDAKQVLYHVASGAPLRALGMGREALERSRPVLAALNRDSAAAEQLLDVCMYLVRAHLQRKELPRARAQALTCRRLVPDMQPKPAMHPPDVLEVLADAEAELRARTPPTLRVTSEPSGCRARVNGRSLGRTPLILQSMAPGRYVVQVACDEHETDLREHPVEMVEESASVHVDTLLDLALDTSADLSLRYTSAGTLSERVIAHTNQVGQVVEAAEAVVVVPLARPGVRIPGIAEGGAPATAASRPGDLEALRVEVGSGRVLGRVRYRIRADLGMSPTQAAAVAEALRAGRYLDVRSGRPLELVASEPSHVGAPSEPPASLGSRTVRSSDVAKGDSTSRGGDSGGRAWLHPAGVVAGIVGTLGVATGWGLWGYHMSLEGGYDEAIASGQTGKPELERLKDFDLVPLTVTAAGALVASIGMFAVLPEAQGVPAGAWLSGGLGVATLAVGTVLLVRGGGCDRFDLRSNRCDDDVSSTRVGGLLAASAAPLVIAPLFYLVDADGSGTDRQDSSWNPPIVPSLALGRRGMTVVVQGSL